MTVKVLSHALGLIPQVDLITVDLMLTVFLRHPFDHKPTISNLMPTAIPIIFQSKCDSSDNCLFSETSKSLKWQLFFAQILNNCR